MATTYRETIQAMVETLQSMYDEAAKMRDAATEDEKAVWNATRSNLMRTWGPLQNLDNQITNERAAELV